VSGVVCGEGERVVAPNLWLRFRWFVVAQANANSGAPLPRPYAPVDYVPVLSRFIPFAGCTAVYR